MAQSPYPVEIHGPEQVIVAGRFTVNGTSDPDGIIGRGFSSISRSDTGEFTITLDKAWPELVSCVVHVYEDDNDIDTVSYDGSGSLVITNDAGSGAVDPSDDVEVHFLAVFQKRTGFKQG